ncbi:MAG: chorismate-binding protein, partial [Flavobacteriaceae bacterium]
FSELFFDEGNDNGGSENIQPNVPSQQNIYVPILKKTIAAIAAGKCKKIVLSRCLEVPNTKNPVALFKDSLRLYPNAFCYLFSHPAVGVWLGATPETFLLAGNGQLRTMALAGTLTTNTGQSEWGDKEFREQQMVTNYILEALGGEVQDISTSTTETVKTGGLLHLRTNVTANYEPEKLSEIIKKLHPTPAVCGVPMTKAKEFVLRNEGYDREFYSGFLGELHMNGNSSAHLFVNLRCMKLMPGRAIVYVGGGITKDSDPIAEWEETVAKSSIMLKVLQGAAPD